MADDTAPALSLQTIRDALLFEENIHDTTFTHAFCQNDPVRFQQILALRTDPDLPIVRHHVTKRYGCLDRPALREVADWLCAELGIKPDYAWHVPIAELALMLKGEDRGKDSPTEVIGQPATSLGPTERPPEQIDPVSKAIALLLDGQKQGRKMRVPDLAGAVGVDKSTLYRNPLFKAAWLAYRTGSKPPKGHKDSEGNLDAYYDPEEVEEDE
jgi:hypothetical protein